MTDKALSMLGIAAKAGNVVSGEFATDKAIKIGSACLVIIANDASDNTKKSFLNSCDFYEVPCYVYGTKESIGKSIGKEFRASLAITDYNLAMAVEKKLQINKTE